MKCHRIVACAIGLLLSSSCVWAFTGPEPTGFDKVKFGTSLEEVRKVYPTMKKPEGKAARITHPKIERYLVPQIKLPGLEKPTDVELQFWNGKFWLGLIHFGDNDQAKCDAYLRERYGAPDYKDDNYMTWTGKTAGAVLTRRQRTFEVHDEGLSNEARSDIFRRSGAQSSAPATPAAHTTAAATPAAQATAAAATPVATAGASPSK